MSRIPVEHGAWQPGSSAVTRDVITEYLEIQSVSQCCAAKENLCTENMGGEIPNLRMASEIQRVQAASHKAVKELAQVPEEPLQCGRLTNSQVFHSVRLSPTEYRRQTEPGRGWDQQQ